MARKRALKIDWKKWLPVGILLLAVPLLAAAGGTATLPDFKPGDGGNGGNGNNGGGNGGNNALPQPGTPNSYNCNLPRGVRNNNPGNLRSGAYASVVANNTDYNCSTRQIERKFLQFQTIEYGILAMIQVLMRGLSFGLPYTPTQVLSKYPNATGQYITAVSQIMGVSPLVPITWNRQLIERAVKAISQFENGKQVITSDQFEYAWTVLFNKPK